MEKELIPIANVFASNNGHQKKHFQILVEKPGPLMEMQSFYAVNASVFRDRFARLIINLYREVSGDLEILVNIEHEPGMLQFERHAGWEQFVNLLNGMHKEYVIRVYSV